MLRKSEERFKRERATADKNAAAANENFQYLEMENKYLKDIKDLNDGFDEYKKQAEMHIATLSADKIILQRKFEENELLVHKLKQTLRNTTNHHEINNKRLREKAARYENELFTKKEEVTKLKNKNTLLKHQIVKLEMNEKKLRTLLLNRD